MATQEISVSAFQTLCAEVADAIAAGTWSTAWSKYGQAEAVNMALELDVSTQGSSIRRRNSLDGLMKALEKSEAKAQRLADRDRMISPRIRHNG